MLDRFLPPPGAPGAVRVAAQCWRGTGDGLTRLADDVRARSAVLTSSWHGPAAEAFAGVFEQFLTAGRGCLDGVGHPDILTETVVSVNEA